MPVNGIADIDGVSGEAIRAFRRRSSAIDEYLAERGFSGAAARQVAALRTRERKDYDVTPAELAPEWRSRASGLGLDQAAIRSLVGRGRRRERDGSVHDRMAAKLAGRNGLTAQASTFDRRDVVEGFAGRAQDGATLEEVEGFADAFLRSSAVVPVVAKGPPGDASDPTSSREVRFTTAELLAVERRILNRAVGGRAVGAGVADPDAVTRALARRPSIGADQSAMVRPLAPRPRPTTSPASPPCTTSSPTAPALTPCASGTPTFPTTSPRSSATAPPTPATADYGTAPPFASSTTATPTTSPTNATPSANDPATAQPAVPTTKPATTSTTPAPASPASTPGPAARLPSGRHQRHQDTESDMGSEPQRQHVAPAPAAVNPYRGPLLPPLDRRRRPSLKTRSTRAAEPPWPTPTSPFHRSHATSCYRGSNGATRLYAR
jgi:hypothetical protein